MPATTSQRHRGEECRGAPHDCAGCVELTRVCGPQEVSRWNQQNPQKQQNQQKQLKRPANKPTKSNKNSKTNKNDKPNKTNNSKPVIRFTNKQRIESKLLNLTLDVNALQEEIRSMEFYRTILQSRVLFKPQAADGSIVHTAQQYFHIFRRGYRVVDAETQVGYLQSFMDEACVTTRCPWAVRLDGLGPTGVGFASLLEQWQTYANYFAFRFLTPPTFTVVSSDADETCVIRCETTLNASFTWQAIDMMFPAVKSYPQLMEQLLGREMVTPMCFHLHFDTQRRMVRHDFEPDFFSALVHALKDPVKAAELVAVTQGPSVEILEESQVDESVPSDLSEGYREEPETPETPENMTVNDVRHSVTYLLS